MDPKKWLLTDRVAIVTGAGNGIGNAIALGFAAHGARLAIIDIDKEALDKAAADIRATGAKVIALHGDVRKQENVDRLVGDCVKQWGGVHVLVNNVGWTMQKLFMDMTEQEWMEMLDVNLVQAFRWTRAAVKVMIEKKIKGSIINISTIEGVRAAPGFTPYSAAKAGLINFTRSMALELAPHWIRMNTILPDHTLSPRLIKKRVDLQTPTRPNQIPLPRRGRPEDHAGAAIFLASDMSAWVTGILLPVDGGSLAASGWKLTPSGHWSTDAVHGYVHSGFPFDYGFTP